jgi:hypothetical protein
MKTAPTFALTIALTAAVAGTAGWFLGRSGSRSEITDLRQESLAARDKVRRLTAQLVEADARAGRVPEKPAIARGPAEGPAMAAQRPARVEPERPDRGERLARIAEIRGKVDRWFEDGKGKEALAALKELAALVPEGREAAMELAVKINQDVNGEGKLKLSQMVFYTNLGTPEIKGLFSWSLANPSSLADFRTMAAYSLPWTQSPEETVKQFSKALRGEKDVGVQRALVWNLSRMRKAEGVAALREVLTDTDRDSSLRAQVATELAMSDDPDVTRDLESLALSDPDLRVRDAAKAAMAMRDPPASGFMITGTVPKSQAEAAGMKAGDILISYNGKATKSLTALRAAATDAGEEDEVPVVVMRGGQEVTLYMRPGQMGVFGRDVKAKDDR